MTLYVRQLVKHFGGVQAVKGVSFDIPVNSTVALVGEPRRRHLWLLAREPRIPRATLELLGRYIQVPWKKNPAEYRAFAEGYFNSVKPLLVKAGLAKA